RRRPAGDARREEPLPGNMRELVDLLVSDADMLPGEAAERISVRRIATRESGRTAANLMEPIPTVAVTCTFRQAAARLVEAHSPIAAVVGPQGDLVRAVH